MQAKAKQRPLLTEAPEHNLPFSCCTPHPAAHPPVSEVTYAELLKVWRRRWEVRLLGLEGFSDLGHRSQDPVSRVQEALLQA